MTAAVRVLDSSAPPTAAQVAQAKAAGWGAWFGYLGQAGDNLLNPWTQADFQTVTDGGLLTGAYCSGQDDPAWVKATAAAWGLHVVVLDDEAGIKTDGSWVSSWCATAGAGLYGNGAVMREHATDPAVPFLVLAAYPGGTQSATWSTTEAGCTTSKPTGWQWAGTVPMFGTTVDCANYDPTIFDAPEENDDMLIVNTPSEGIWLLSGGLYAHIMDPATVTSMSQAGVKTVSVDDATHQNLVTASARTGSSATSLNLSGTFTGTAS